MKPTLILLTVLPLAPLAALPAAEADARRTEPNCESIAPFAAERSKEAGHITTMAEGQQLGDHSKNPTTLPHAANSERGDVTKTTRSDTCHHSRAKGRTKP